MIEEKHPGRWLVSGQWILLTNATVIDDSLGPPVIGAEVRADGIRRTALDVLEAEQITVLRANLEWNDWTGFIDSFGGAFG